jgi:hypothetical protein
MPETDLSIFICPCVRVSAHVDFLKQVPGRSKTTQLSVKFVISSRLVGPFASFRICTRRVAVFSGIMAVRERPMRPEGNLSLLPLSSLQFAHCPASERREGEVGGK